MSNNKKLRSFGLGVVFALVPLAAVGLSLALDPGSSIKLMKDLGSERAVTLKKFSDLGCTSLKIESVDKSVLAICKRKDNYPLVMTVPTIVNIEMSNVFEKPYNVTFSDKALYPLPSTFGKGVVGKPLYNFMLSKTVIDPMLTVMNRAIDNFKSWGSHPVTACEMDACVTVLDDHAFGAITKDQNLIDHIRKELNIDHSPVSVDD